MGTASSKQNDERPRVTKEEVALLPLVPHVVYASLCEHVYNEPDRRPLPDGWRVLMTCEEVQLNREGYYATAYVNDHLRHCIIAERGTSDALGIRAGIWAYFEEPTIQFALAEKFSKLVRLRLGMMRGNSETTKMFATSTGGFAVSYAGHSLGAVLAACRACAEHTFAVTFESPGCKAFVEKTMYPFKAEDVDIVTYLRPPNAINTLKPQCGYLMQLPGQMGINLKPTAQQTKAGFFTFALPNPQDYLRSKLLEKSIPELQEYLGKIEPILRELLEHTQQMHSISSIVDSFANSPEPATDVILVWPSHLMQFIEVFNTTKAMEDVANQSSHVYSAYESLLHRLYLTAKRPVHKLPLRILNSASRRLVRLWYALPATQLRAIPLSPIECKVLNTTSIEGSNLISDVLTALQMKQFLSLVTARTDVQNAFDGIDFDTQSVSSKL